MFINEQDYTVALSPASEGDREFLIRVYADGRRDELARAMWTDEQTRMFVEHQLDAQTRHYHTVYPNSTHEIIRWNDEPAGRLFLDRGLNEIAILDITVLSDYRCRGIASRLVEELQKEASAHAKPVRIYVESFNPCAAFFIKRGFQVTEQDGVNVKYVWMPT